jgi:hypothetical protein
LHFSTDSEELRSTVEAWSDYIKAETLTVALHESSEPLPEKAVNICGEKIVLSIAKA